MGMRDFLRDIPYSLNGKHYGEIAERPMSSGVFYILGLVVLAFFIMCIFGIPSVINFGNYIEDQMSKIDKIQIDGRILMYDAIKIPEEDPYFVIDATNNSKKAESRKILITQEYFYWKPVVGEPKKVKMADWFRNKESRNVIASFIFLISLLVLPGFLFWLLVLLFLKYLLIVTLFAGIFFIVLDLTRYKISFKKMFNICAYAATLLIFIEVIFIPLGTDLLIPLFSIFWVQFYLVTLAIYLSLVILALIFAEYEGEGSHPRKKKREESEEEEEEEPPKKQEPDEIPVDEYGNRIKKNEEEFAWDGPVEKF
ncbi:DUF1189 family protein [Candidatus Woesearchaeota archaeon]|nr:DUF1189 family protein [Candidatus Woesearchaeota archaeon]